MPRSSELPLLDPAMTHWPTGTPIALLVNVMYEQWDPAAPPGLGPMGNPLRPGLVDHQAASWSDYGWRSGIHRLLRVLGHASVRSTVYASGLLAVTAPNSLRDTAGEGHEVCGHAWTQDLLLPGLDLSTERAQLERSLDALTRATTTTPVGWMSPRCTPSANTAALLAEAGIRWTGDVFDADLPYRLDVPQGELVAYPFGLEVNDVPMNVRYGQPAREMATTFHDLVEAVTGEDRLAYIDVTVHAHVGARPLGLSALGRILAEAKDRGLWIATRTEALDHLVGSL